jgi:organic radical activating enzyme
MNILTISIINSCNKSCYYCPVKKWLVPINTDRKDVNMIKNNILFAWIDRYLNADEWFIELTGGEPGLYPEIKKLINGLDTRGYRGLIKTNGSLPIPKTDNFKILSAWHKDHDFPLYYDEIIIIKNPDDNWQDKVIYCEKNNIKYHTVKYDKMGIPGEVKIDSVYCFHNKTINTCHINSSGQITKCASDPVVLENTIFNMAMPQLKNVIIKCPKCKNINDIEMFLDRDMKERFENDVAKLKKTYRK